MKYFQPLSRPARRDNELMKEYVDRMLGRLIAWAGFIYLATVAAILFYLAGQ